MSERNDTDFVDDEGLVADQGYTKGEKSAVDEAHEPGSGSPDLRSAEEGKDGFAADHQAVSKVERLERENADLRDQFLRLRAEFENFRRRVAKEKEDIQEYASVEAVRPLLAIADDFERALSVGCQDSEYAKGMELIYQRMGEALRKIGVETHDALGKPFDPNLHHAIDMVKTSEAPDNTVLEVFQAGYTYKGKLIRPAIVKVAVEPDAN